MIRYFGMSVIVIVAVTASTPVFAKEPKQVKTPPVVSVQKNSQSDLESSTKLGFAPDGLAHDVMILMSGLSHPIDGSTNLTVQAGTSFRLGLTF